MPGREFRFGRADSGHLGMLTSGTEGGDRCGWWQPPVADRFSDRLRRLCLADWCDAIHHPPRHHTQPRRFRPARWRHHHLRYPDSIIRRHRIRRHEPPQKNHARGRDALVLWLQLQGRSHLRDSRKIRSTPYARSRLEPLVPFR